MRDMTQNATTVSLGASTVTSATVATGFLDTVNQYAPLIGICLSSISVLLAVIFFTLNHRKESIRHKQYVEDLRNSIRDDLIKELTDEQSTSTRISKT